MDNNSTEMCPSGIAGYSSIANYNFEKLIIKICEKDLWITNCNVLLHEFTHHLQHILGREMGGFCPRTLSKKLSIYPTEFAIETEADLNTLRRHPSINFLKRVISINVNVPYGSVEGLKKILDYWKWGKISIYNIDRAFPYLQNWACYAVLFHDQVVEYNSEKMSIDDEIAALYKEECENEQKGHLTLEALKKAMCQDGNPFLHQLAKKFTVKEDYCKEQTEEIKKRLCKSYNTLTPELKNKIANAKNYRSGSEEFFAIREKLGLVPK